MYTYARVTNCPAAHNAPPRHAQTNAKLGAYIGYDVWNLTSNNGTTIKDALDYAITLPAGTETASELWPNVVAVGAVYGDADGAYAKWMLEHAGKFYPADAQFLWNQPFSDSGILELKESKHRDPGIPNYKHRTNGAAGLRSGIWHTLMIGMAGVVVVLLMA